MRRILNLVRPFARLVLGLALACVALGVEGAARVQAAALVVDRADDVAGLLCTGAANDCSLRSAIQIANANGVGDTITFAAGYTITLGSPLVLTEAGTAITGNQLVWINANNTGQVFRVAASDTTLDGLRVYGSSIGTANIWISDTAQRVRIANNIIGDNDPGFLGACGNSPNSHTGIFINSTAVPSGSDAVAWIYGNNIKCIGGIPGHGIQIVGTDEVVVGADSAGNAGSAQGNFIELNNGDGVYLFNGANNNVIRNSYLQYNDGSGLVIDNSDNNVAYGSYFQVNDQPGIVITNTATLNRIGCPLGNANPNDPNLFNVIHQNNNHGIHVFGAGTDANLMLCNRIGLNDAGTAAAGNDGDGVRIEGGAANNILGVTSGTRNTISGNALNGVYLAGAGTKGNLVQGNYIGVNIGGVAAVRNELDGVRIINGASQNTIGGDAFANLNLIAGNADFGISISGSGTTTNTVTLNDIGYNSLALLPLPNGGDGLILAGGTSGNIIGGTGIANFIAYNAASGIYLTGGAVSNQIRANEVFSNTLWGVVLDGGSTSLNLISRLHSFNNGYDGIAERNGATLNVWQQISTHGNGGLGIDKNVSGLTDNTPTGPFPVITSVNVATGVINGTATANTLVEVYQVHPDPSGFGEGQTFVGSDVSNGSGNWSLTLAPGSTGCYTAFETVGFIIYSSSEFGPNSCRTFLPLIQR
jgi:hypothetical protein